MEGKERGYYGDPPLADLKNGASRLKRSGRPLVKKALSKVLDYIAAVGSSRTAPDRIQSFKDPVD